jgi:hypothetical protein
MSGLEELTFTSGRLADAYNTLAKIVHGPCDGSAPVSEREKAQALELMLGQIGDAKMSCDRVASLITKHADVLR